MKALSLSLALGMALALVPAPLLAQDALATASPVASPRDEALTPDQIREDFDLARKALEEIPFPVVRIAQFQGIEGSLARHPHLLDSGRFPARPTHSGFRGDYEPPCRCSGDPASVASLPCAEKAAFLSLQK